MYEMLDIDRPMHRTDVLFFLLFNLWSQKLYFTYQLERESKIKKKMKTILRSMLQFADNYLFFFHDNEHYANVKIRWKHSCDKTERIVRNVFHSTQALNNSLRSFQISYISSGLTNFSFDSENQRYSSDDELW